MKKSNKNPTFKMTSVETKNSKECDKGETEKKLSPKRKKTVPNKKPFKGQINCPCRLRCAQNIDILTQKSIFDEYNGLNWSYKTRFLRSLTERKPTKKNLNPTKNVKKRNFVSKYFVCADDGIKHQICSSFLTKILRISRKTLYRAIESVERNPDAIDLRGKYPTRKTDFRDIQFCRQFINKFATFDTHHNYKYLHPRLRIKTMYHLYCRTFESINDRKMLSKYMFRKIFMRDFNLRTFKRTKKCEVCTVLKNNQCSMVLRAKGKLQIKQNIKMHKSEIKSIQREFFNCVENATEGEGIEVFTFGMQTSQEIPSVPEKSSLQFRPLWCHNFCVYDEVRGKGYMFFWSEIVASKGTKEIAACLYKHFRSNIEQNSSQIILYSDPNSGQTRNIKLSILLHYFFVNECVDLQIMEQRFFNQGHSYNSCKRCFKCIDKQRKMIERLSVPEDWFCAVTETKFNGKYFNCYEMKREDFFLVEKLEPLIAEEIKNSNARKEIDWSTFESITFDRNDPFTVKIKTNDDKQISIFLKSDFWLDDFIKESNPVSPEQMNLAISKQKYEDLNNLLKFISKPYHEFYKSLNYTENDKNKDYGLVSRETSEEED